MSAGSIGVGNLARTITGMQMGVAAVAHTVNAAYIGVNGVAQQWYGNNAELPQTILGLTESRAGYQAGLAGIYSLFVGGMTTSTTGAPYSSTIDVYDDMLMQLSSLTMPDVRVNSGGGTISGCLLVCGGYNNSNQLHTIVDIYNGQLVRSTASPMPVGLLAINKSVVVGDKLVVAGASSATSNIFVYDSTFALSTQPLSGTINPVCGVSNVSGGMFINNDTTRRFFSLDLSSTVGAARGGATSGMTGFMLAGSSVIAGGNASSTYYSVVDRYDSAFTMSALANLVAGRNNLTSTVGKKVGIVAGGLSTPPTQYFSTVDVYSTLFTHSVAPNLYAGRIALNAVTNKNGFMLVGSGQVSGGYTSIIDVYDQDLNHIWSVPTGYGIVAGTLYNDYTAAATSNMLYFVQISQFELYNGLLSRLGIFSNSLGVSGRGSAATATNTVIGLATNPSNCTIMTDVGTASLASMGVNSSAGVPIGFSFQGRAVFCFTNGGAFAISDTGNKTVLTTGMARGAGFTSVANDNYFFACGGSNSNTVVPTVYDSSFTLVSGISSLSTSSATGDRAQMGAAHIGSYALIAGGGSTSLARTNINSFVDCYDGTATKVVVPPLGTAVSWLAGAGLGAVGIFSGGSTTGTGTGVVASAYVYSDALTASGLPALSIARDTLWGAGFGSFIVFGGGRQKAGNNVAVIDAYDTSLNHYWSGMPTPTTATLVSTTIDGITFIYSESTNPDAAETYSGEFPPGDWDVYLVNGGT